MADKNADFFHGRISVSVSVIRVRRRLIILSVFVSVSRDTCPQFVSEQFVLVLRIPSFVIWILNFDI